MKRSNHMTHLMRALEMHGSLAKAEGAHLKGIRCTPCCPSTIMKSLAVKGQASRRLNTTMLVCTCISTQSLSTRIFHAGSVKKLGKPSNMGHGSSIVQDDTEHRAIQ